ncbi:9985_t:CDS:2 [Paraglomus brasilianum]|uniref:Sulfide:quinone oxidoreductase, mitochondrial n=1 Tax=Paraglomus brasilianum TaxID=144538 RepID=A0A9N9CWS5_9GLOM|nr:9985_t:CDS:2 [Paraglomus brasilianum]
MFARTHILSRLSRFPSNRRFASSNPSQSSYQVVVVGGGTGGLAVSSTLSEVLGRNAVAVIEPASYQPLWTLVGGGVKPFSASSKPVSEVMPPNVSWIKNKAIEVKPESNFVVLQDGQQIKYDYLVVAAGIQLNWNKVKGLPEALGNNGVSSNYAEDSVEKTWKFIQEFKGGNAVFTMPSTPIKCPGAAIKIAYLAEDHFRNAGVRQSTRVIYNTGMGKIFSVEKYANSLLRVAKDRGIEVNLSSELVEIRADRKEAVFKSNKTGEESVLPYDFLHAVPPMGPPDFIAKSNIGNAAGWVDVDQYTLQHNKYPNIYSLGDSSSVPTSKTAAAIAVQSGVLKHNLLSAMRGNLTPLTAAKYDGYCSCPLFVGRDQLILAEFNGFNATPMETFPFDQGKERGSMYFLTKEIIPEIYWRGLLKGTWVGPGRFRSYFN